MKVLTCQEIAAKETLGLVPVPIPQWGDDCGVMVAKVPGRQRAEFKKTLHEDDDNFTVMTKTVAYFACNEDGLRLYKDAADVEAQINNLVVIERIGEEALRANAMLKTSLDDAKKN